MLFKRIKDWATSITAFRTGDVIPVDGPNGTAKMPKESLIGLVVDPSVPKGSASVNTLNGTITGLAPGWTYTLTDAGTLSAGSVAVIIGDKVTWNGTKWIKTFNAYPNFRKLNVGVSNTISSNNSAAIGYGNTASSSGSFVHGFNCTSMGDYSSVLSGESNIASGRSSSASGSGSSATGNFSQAHGIDCVASAYGAIARGLGCIAKVAYQFVHGRYNEEDNEGKFIEIVGGGENSSSRKNIRTLSKSGEETITGDFYYNHNVKSLDYTLLNTKNFSTTSNTSVNPYCVFRTIYGDMTQYVYLKLRNFVKTLNGFALNISYGTSEFDVNTANVFFENTNFVNGLLQKRINVANGYLVLVMDNTVAGSVPSTWLTLDFDINYTLVPKENLKDIIDYNTLIKEQDDSVNSYTTQFKPIPFKTAVINTDAVCGNLHSNDSGTTFQWLKYTRIYNEDTSFNGYWRLSWGAFDYSSLNDYLYSCVQNKSKCVFGVSHYSGYEYDNVVIKKPADYTEYQAEYESGLGVEFTFNGSDELIIDSLIVKCGYPNEVFWAQVKEQKCPTLETKESFIWASLNYNSDSVYNLWSQFINDLHTFLEGNLLDGNGDAVYINGNSLKRRNCIQTLRFGLGIYGEGGVRSDAMFPMADETKAVRYYTDFLSVFNDYDVNFPLAIVYDIGRYRDSTIIDILNMENDNGVVGIYNDVVGYSPYPSMYYLRGQNRKFAEKLFHNRRVSGEFSGAYAGDYAACVLREAIQWGLYGFSFTNIVVKSETAIMMYCKALSFIGARLFLSKAELDEVSGVLTLNIQNYGISKVWSKCWKVYCIFCDNNSIISRQEIPLDITTIAPNSTDFEFVGLIKKVDDITYNMSIPTGTTKAFLSIEDVDGLYENYWLSNNGRTEDGNYEISIT